MSNLLRDSLANLNLPVTRSFMENAAIGFASGAASFFTTKYIVQIYDKKLGTNPLVVAAASMPSFIYGLLGNDHKLAGSNFGLSGLLTFVNPLYGLTSIPTIAHEVYCNNYDCGNDGNIVTRFVKKIELPVTSEFLEASIISTVYSGLSILGTRYLLSSYGQLPAQNQLAMFVAGAMSTFLPTRNDHDTAGAYFGSGIALSLINPAYSIISLAGLLEEIYCNNYQCDKNSNIIKKFITEKLNITYPSNEFMTEVIRGFSVSEITLLSTKYLLPTILSKQAKLYFDHPLAAVAMGIVLPNLLNKLAGNDHEFSGKNLGLSIPLVMVDPKYAAFSALTIAQETYCNFYECSPRTNMAKEIVDKIHFPLEFIHNSVISYISFTASLLAIKNLGLLNQDTTQGKIFSFITTPAYFIFSMAKPATSIAMMAGYNALAFSGILPPFIIGDNTQTIAIENITPHTDYTTALIFLSPIICMGFYSNSLMAGFSLAYSQVETDTKIGMTGLAIATGAQALPNILNNDFLGAGIVGLLASAASLYVMKYIALDQPNYDNNKIVAAAAALIPGFILAATTESNDKMTGVITGSSASLLYTCPEVAYAGMVCSALGELYLKFNETIHG